MNLKKVDCIIFAGLTESKADCSIYMTLLQLMPEYNWTDNNIRKKTNIEANTK